jgi:beta-lactamase regulating signal transducer with metallopeptidase domain
MMLWFVALAAKSLVVAGGTLLLLRLMSKRSAADRSWIAHLGLAALLLLPVASYALPALEVQGPSFLAAEPSTTIVADPVAPAPEVAAPTATFRAEQAAVVPAPVDWERWGYWGYVLPAALLLLLTLIAVGRLIALKARAQVLVDGQWLSALARAQSRMGFKSGTALLTSDELRSPVSWGLMRPVIVLNHDAAEAHDEAEAIIAHELAHVARLDWAKLLLARIAVAIFWFNPLVWMLAREAHQLREEAADDAVLGSDIDDTDYARLLVGIARHECNGMLLGAHGVAPSRNSLSRRVRRVLDRALDRAPGGWRWTSAAAFFAAGMAVPVAALNFVPTDPVEKSLAAPASVGGKRQQIAAADPQPAIAAVTAAAAAHPHPDAADDQDQNYDYDYEADIDHDADRDTDFDSEDFNKKINDDVREAMAEARAEARAASREARASMAEARGELRALSRSDKAIDKAVSARVVGVTPTYTRDMRASAPSLAKASTDDLIAMRIHGVTPDMVRQLRQAGHRDLTPKQLTEAAIHGVNGSYVREMAAVGYTNLSLKDLGEMRMMGVSADYVRDFQKAGYKNLTVKQLIRMRMAGVKPDEVQRAGSP